MKNKRTAFIKDFEALLDKYSLFLECRLNDPTEYAYSFRPEDDWSTCFINLGDLSGILSGRICRYCLEDIEWDGGCECSDKVKADRLEGALRALGEKNEA